MFEQEIAEGIKLLDAKGGFGWRDRIDKDQIVMYNPYKCILGQLYGDYWKGCRELDFPGAGADYGFALAFSDEYSDSVYTAYKQLKWEWISELS